jgi:lysophospholipase L1-like esterase
VRNAGPKLWSRRVVSLAGGVGSEERDRRLTLYANALLKWIVLPGILPLMCASQASAAILQAADPGLLYEGRLAVERDGAVRLAFPGVSAFVHFRGESLSVRLECSCEGTGLDVSVDGAKPVLLPLNNGVCDYVLLPKGATAEHSVVLVRRNEAWQGINVVRSFDLGPDGVLLAPPERPERKTMFIGDSVTGGELAAWVPGADVKNHLYCNARISFGKLLAERLDAQCHLVSYGGRGIIRDWQGLRETANAPQFYERALPDEASSVWNHKRYVPDLIGVGLGTNDFNPGIPEEKEFVNAYVGFVKKLRCDAPEAEIFLMESPILADDSQGGPKRSILRAYLTRIVRQAGTSKVHLASLSHYAGVPGNGHPSGADHAAMADELEPQLRRIMRW